MGVRLSHLCYHGSSSSNARKQNKLQYHPCILSIVLLHHASVCSRAFGFPSVFASRRRVTSPPYYPVQLPSFLCINHSHFSFFVSFFFLSAPSFCFLRFGFNCVSLRSPVSSRSASFAFDYVSLRSVFCAFDSVLLRSVSLHLSSEHARETKNRPSCCVFCFLFSVVHELSRGRHRP